MTAVTAEGQQAIAEAIRERARAAGLSFMAMQSCIDLGKSLNIYGAEPVEAIGRACHMVEVIAREVSDSRVSLRNTRSLGGVA